MSSVALIKRMRQARELKVPIEGTGFEFTILRPTDWDTQVMLRDRASFFDVARDHVIGWNNVREVDLVKGGTTDPAEFDSMIWAEWLADRPDFWEPLNKAITEAYTKHQEKKNEAAKK